MTGLESERRELIEKELQRIEESAMYSAQAQFERAKRWRGIGLSLGLPGSILAAVSGATALASTTGRIAAGIIALVSAALTGTLTVLAAGHRTDQATAAANVYLGIQTAARQAREIDLPYISAEDARANLADLTTRIDEQNKAADPPSKGDFQRAKANITGGGQTYAVDEKS